MIKLGNPFSEGREYEKLIASLEDSLRDGVVESNQQIFTFRKEDLAYRLDQKADVLDIHVTGKRHGAPMQFQRNVHFSFAQQLLTWTHATELPDDKSAFEAVYTYRLAPSGLTDFNEGSVTSTLVRVLARELKFLYETMDQAYRRAFIDEASKPALDYVVALLGITRNEAVKAKGKGTFARQAATPDRVEIRLGTRVADVRGRVFETTEADEIPANQPSVEIEVQAITPGRDGNVAANTITIMPTPPIGVNSVTNNKALEGGEEEEPDAQLRERAKHALETSGKATLNAIKFAVRDVDGVVGVEVADYSSDDSIPLGEVRVRFFGGDEDKVKTAVEQTRAAGISPRLEAILEILVFGTFYVIPDKSFSEEARSSFKAAVVAALKKLGIGEPLVVRRLNALVYDIPGLAEVAEAKLKSSKNVEIKDTYFPARTELLRPDEANKANIAVIRLDALQAAIAEPKTQPSTITIKVKDENNAAVPFNEFSLALNATFYAPFKNAPNSKERVGSMIRTIKFANSADGKFEITKDDISKDKNVNRAINLSPDQDATKIEVLLNAAAYSGLKETKVIADLSSLL